jgi:hypothetical protein
MYHGNGVSVVDHSVVVLLLLVVVVIVVVVEKQRIVRGENRGVNL